ncbi:MAG: hypothetical protein ACIARR_11575, partial [Phycisphaerales bacterium JB059]
RYCPPMDTICPNCSADIPPHEVNVAENVAYCRACDTLHRLSELADQERVEAPATDEPPAGAYIRDLGRDIRVGATCRSPSTALFFIIFAGFWNAIVGVFLFNAVASLLGYNGLGASSTGFDLFTLIFMIPFVIVGLITAFIALMALFGRVEVRIAAEKAHAFTGLGPLGWRRPFDATRVSDITIETANSSTNGKPDRHIVIEAQDATVKLGSVLSRTRRRWLAGALTQLLISRR